MQSSKQCARCGAEMVRKVWQRRFYWRCRCGFESRFTGPIIRSRTNDSAVYVSGDVGTGGKHQKVAWWTHTQG